MPRRAKEAEKIPSGNVSISKAIFYDKKLSLKAKAVLCLALSFSKKRSISPPELASIMGVTNSIVYKSIQELIKHKYALKTTLRANGKIVGVNYQFSHNKFLNLKNTNIENERMTKDKSTKSKQESKNLNNF